MVLRCPSQRKVTEHHSIWAQLGSNWAVGWAEHQRCFYSHHSEKLSVMSRGKSREVEPCPIGLLFNQMLVKTKCGNTESAPSNELKVDVPLRTKKGKK